MIKDLNALIEIAKLIQIANPETILSGSLALNMQDVKTRREVKDLDFFIPFGVKINLIQGMRFSPPNERDEMYENEFYELIKCTYNNVEIDFFKPVDADVKGVESNTVKGVKVVYFIDILRMKFMHVFGEHYTRFKHVQDLQFILSNIS